MSRLTVIVAATKTNGIGQNSRLPWRLPKEMAYFKRVTSNAPEASMNAVIMGRKTWESIPERFKPLPKRTNIAISRNVDYELLPPGSSSPSVPVHLHSDLHSAIKRLSNPDYSDSTSTIHRGFIIGGASLYSDFLALPLASQTAFVDRVLLTRIISPAFEQCDVFMPPDFLEGTRVIDGVNFEWKRASHADLEAWVEFTVPEGVQEENGVEYEFQMWVRGD